MKSILKTSKRIMPVIFASLVLFAGCSKNPKKDNSVATKEIETILQSSTELLEKCEKLNSENGNLTEDNLKEIEGSLKISKDFLTLYGENISESKLEAEKNIQTIESLIQEKRNEIETMNLLLGKNLYVEQNLRLREAQDGESKIKCTMTFGTKVNVIEVGKDQTIDSVKGNWVKVKIASSTYDRDGKKLNAGTTGWCFSGYLSEKISYENLIGVWEEVRFDKNGKLVYEGNMRDVKNDSGVCYSGLIFDADDGYERFSEFEYDSWLGMDMVTSYTASYNVDGNLIQLSNVIGHYTGIDLIDDETWQIVYLEKDALGLRRIGTDYPSVVEYRRAK